MLKPEISSPLSANKNSAGIKFYIFRNVLDRWMSNSGILFLFRMLLLKLIKLGGASLLLNPFCLDCINLMLLCHRIFWILLLILCIRNHKIGRMNLENKIMTILILMRSLVLVNYKVYFKYFIDVRCRLKAILIIQIRWDL